MSIFQVLFIKPKTIIIEKPPSKIDLFDINNNFEECDKPEANE